LIEFFGDFSKTGKKGLEAAGQTKSEKQRQMDTKMEELRQL